MFYILAVQHERGPRNSTLKKQQLQTSRGIQGPSAAGSISVSQYASNCITTDIMHALLKAEPKGISRGKKSHCIDDILYDGKYEKVK